MRNRRGRVRKGQISPLRKAKNRIPSPSFSCFQNAPSIFDTEQSVKGDCKRPGICRSARTSVGVGPFDRFSHPVGSNNTEYAAAMFSSRAYPELMDGMLQ